MFNIQSPAVGYLLKATATSPQLATSASSVTRARLNNCFRRSYCMIGTSFSAGDAFALMFWILGPRTFYQVFSQPQPYFAFLPDDRTPRC